MHLTDSDSKAVIISEKIFFMVVGLIKHKKIVLSTAALL